MQVSLTGGIRDEVTQLMPLIQAIPPMRGRRGRPRHRPDAIYAGRGYDHDKYRKQVRDVGITSVIDGPDRVVFRQRRGRVVLLHAGTRSALSSSFAIPDRLRDRCGQPSRIEESSTVRGEAH
ncbi:MAG: hypothetical protein ACJ73U_35370, partial [Actinophytocola sp.]